MFATCKVNKGVIYGDAESTERSCSFGYDAVCFYENNQF